MRIDSDEADARGLPHSTPGTDAAHLLDSCVGLT
jgi:hypothetical protein